MTAVSALNTGEGVVSVYGERVLVPCLLCLSLRDFRSAINSGAVGLWILA